jgi:formylglycine-generating enzyme
MRAERQLKARRIARAIALAGVFATSAVACADETVTIVTAQVVLHFETDAPLPLNGMEELGAEKPAALFDRLRVDVFAPGASTPCDGCTNEFEVDTSVFQDHRASIGLAPPVGVAGYRARVRLFKAGFSDSSGQPDPSSSIDVVVALPVMTEGNVVERTVNLATDDVGQPRGTLTEPIEAASGKPAGESRVGTWASARRVGCAGPEPPGSACIRGGAVWLGDPNSPGFLLAVTATNVQIESPEPRLVVLSPFYLQLTETTVAQFRAEKLDYNGGWSGSRSGENIGDWCTYTVAPGPYDAMPLNCVSAYEATAYCTAKGAALPTEAQFAYASGALVGRPYVWGRDAPSCTDAVYGRAGWGVLENIVSPCRPDEKEKPGHFAEPGSGKLDRLRVGRNEIVDLAGNLTEWTSDFWNRLEEPCWQRRGIYRDPRCGSMSTLDGELIVVRGGNWTSPFNMMQSTKRRGIQAKEKSVSAGFRCVWKAEPAP